MRTFTLLLMLVAASTKVFEPEDEKAPDFQNISSWVNSEPLEMQKLQGKVVLVDFWTYSCINCIRTFPYLKSWYNKYKDKGLIIIGVHTPEFSFEHTAENVKKAIERYGLNYPIALDNDYATWRAYHNQYWPTSYLIDQKGFIRLRHIGEGNYVEMENAIRELLNLDPMHDEEKEPEKFPTTPEIYLGSARAQSYTSENYIIPNAVRTYSFKVPPSEDKVAIKGQWKVLPESLVSAGSGNTMVLNFYAKKVHAVIGGKSSAPLTLLLDGKPLEKENFTKDMDNQGKIYVDHDRKYDLCQVPGDMKQHTLTIKVPEGISFYTFTFGSEL